MVPIIGILFLGKCFMHHYLLWNKYDDGDEMFWKMRNSNMIMPYRQQEEGRLHQLKLITNGFYYAALCLLAIHLVSLAVKEIVG